MADLDALYTRCIAEDDLDPLMAAVLAKAKRLIRDDDAAANAALFILERLTQFKMTGPTSFTRWVFSVCRRRRLESYRNRGHEEFIDEMYVPDEWGYRNYSQLPETLRSIATALSDGVTLHDLAASEGVTAASLRKKILRQCPIFAT